MITYINFYPHTDCLSLSFVSEPQRQIFEGWLENSRYYSQLKLKIESSFSVIYINIQRNQIAGLLKFLLLADEISQETFDSFNRKNPSLISPELESSSSSIIKTLGQNNETRIPALPSIASKGYNSEGYWELMRSLSAAEKKELLAELNKPEIITRADQLEADKKAEKDIPLDLNDTRNTFLSALLCLQRGTFTINELASLHLRDAAVRALYTHPVIYLKHHYVDTAGNEVINVSHCQTHNQHGSPNAIKRCHYDDTLSPIENMTTLPERMQSPLLKRFFNFTPDEWIHFCHEMDTASYSEKLFSVLTAPSDGCWSSIISTLQEVIKCLQTLDCAKITRGGNGVIEKIMPIPSFTMFQAAINVKAKSLTPYKKPVKLIPTYHYLNEDLYAEHKAVRYIPITMYLPPAIKYKQYNNNFEDFRKNLDGHPFEGPLAGAYHDVYHALRELQISDQVSDARLRLAYIAKYHPLDKKSNMHKSVFSILIDGELTYSYSASCDTTFSRDANPHRQIFGDIFYTSSLLPHLHPELKKAFITDMVLNQDDWFDCFCLDKYDLRESDQLIFDEIDKENQKNNTTSIGRSI